MESIVFAYCKTNDIDFERTIPLHFVGQRNRSLGYSNDLHILFTAGYNRLSLSYIRSLQELGFHIHDVSSLHEESKRRFVGLSQFNEHQQHTFLRWPVVASFLKGEPFIHYDGDVVFNENPAVIAEKLAGTTFVLQGCPALTVVTQQAWLDTYLAHLVAFSRNIEQYCERAWAERPGWDITFGTRWSGYRSSRIFQHDQDLLSHLIHTGRIQQESVEAVMRRLRNYSVFENPLYIGVYEVTLPFTYRRELGVDYLSFTDGGEFYKKRVLLWHMQGYFTRYAGKYLRRKRLVGSLASLARNKLDLSGTSFEVRLRRRLHLLRHTHRLEICEYFFRDADFSGLLRNRTWWREGVFSDDLHQDRQRRRHWV